MGRVEGRFAPVTAAARGQGVRTPCGRPVLDLASDGARHVTEMQFTFDAWPLLSTTTAAAPD